MEFLAQYGLFLAQVLTVVIAILVTFIGIYSISNTKSEHSNQITIKHINKQLQETKELIYSKILSKEEIKAQKKEKKSKTSTKTRLFVLDFSGDIQASAVSQLRQEITAIILIAKPGDEVLLRLQSGGGLVPHYGLASAQLARLKQHNIPLTISIDKIAASGGYMMACIANNIIAAPFAIVGSIGVIAEFPNFNKWLKKHDIEVEHHHIGDYKRTLTMFGENTEEDRDNFIKELQEVHILFKAHIQNFRNQIDIDTVANGKFWFATQALEHKLIDKIQTSDDFLLTQLDKFELYQLHYQRKKSLLEKLLKKDEEELE